MRPPLVDEGRDVTLLGEMERTLGEYDRRREELLARIAEERGEDGIIPYVPPEKLWMTFDDVRAERAGIGPRSSTGMALLDAKLDGGLYAGTLSAVQGPPGAGKTALATQIAFGMARGGCSVAAYFGDEGNAGAFVTICQQLGVSRTAVLGGDNPAIDLASEAVLALPWFRIVRPSHRDATLEKMVEGLVRMSPNGAPRVLLIDSAQVLRLANEKPRESPVERVQRAVHELREQTLANALITLLVTRVHRGSFGKKKEEEEVDPIAAAWGGAVEWLAELILHIDGKPTPEDPKARLRVAKNRVSAAGVFTVPLRIEWARKRFVEVDPREDEAEKNAARAKALQATKEKILAALKGRDGVATATLKKEVGGKASAFVAARQDLTADGLIHARKRKGHGGGEDWYLGPLGSAPSRPPSGQAPLLPVDDVSDDRENTE